MKLFFIDFFFIDCYIYHNKYSVLKNNLTLKIIIIIRLSFKKIMSEKVPIYVLKFIF